MSQAPAQTSAPASKPAARGPVGLLLATALGLVFATLLSWMFGVVIEIVGLYFLWPEQGVKHSAAQVQEEIDYITAYPRCLMARDTVQFATSMANTVTQSAIALGVLRFIQSNSAPVAVNEGVSRVKRSLQGLLREVARYALIAIYVAQDIAVRLSVVFFALPLFVLLCLLAVVDGLVRRDVRRWSAGRESSFIYHHAKTLHRWVLSSGFAIYLAWPFGGVNPVVAVTALCVLAALTMSITVSSFKKYL
jgi:integrating conjugative element membrane protein (TIGR03747 family)